MEEWARKNLSSKKRHLSEDEILNESTVCQLSQFFALLQALGCRHLTPECCQNMTACAVVLAVTLSSLNAQVLYFPGCASTLLMLNMLSENLIDADTSKR